MKWKFANLMDIIRLKKAEIQLSQAEVNRIFDQECEGVEKCPLRSEITSCEFCNIKKECREDTDKSYAEADILEEEIRKTELKIKYLRFELFLSRHKDAQIEYHNLELFP